MLVRLLPGQVSELWKLLKWHIAKSLPYGENDKVFGRILNAIVKGAMDVFVYYDQQGDEATIKAVITTTLNLDHITGEKNLILYSITGQEGLDAEAMRKGFTGLTNYAREIGCKRILAYTTNERIEKLAEYFNFKKTSTLLALEV